MLPVLLLLSGCSFMNDAMWPSLTSEPPAQEATQVAPVPQEAVVDEGPPPSAKEIDESLIRIERSLIGLSGRADLHGELFTHRQEGLAGLVRGFTLREDGPLSSEDWLDAQLMLSRLGVSLSELGTVRGALAADAAKAVSHFAEIGRLSRRSDLAKRHRAPLGELRILADVVLTQLGELDGGMESDYARYDAFITATTQRIEAIRPTRLTIRLPEPKGKARKKEDAKSGPSESGDRFAGRKPLAVLTYPDDAPDPAPQLRDLLEKVTPQYPDLAFDIETLGAPEDGLKRVLGLLKEFGVEATVFQGALAPEEAPALKLYPR